MHSTSTVLSFFSEVKLTNFMNLSIDEQTFILNDRVA
jgi:hypothetical protein